MRAETNITSLLFLVAKGAAARYIDCSTFGCARQRHEIGKRRTSASAPGAIKHVLPSILSATETRDPPLHAGRRHLRLFARPPLGPIRGGGT